MEERRGPVAHRTRGKGKGTELLEGSANGERGREEPREGRGEGKGREGAMALWEGRGGEEERGRNYVGRPVHCAIRLRHSAPSLLLSAERGRVDKEILCSVVRSGKGEGEE